MGKTFREFTGLLLRAWYAAGPGFVLTLIGILREADIVQILPTWTWWLAALFAFWIASFSAFRNVHRKLQALQKPAPDMSLVDVVIYRLGPANLITKGSNSNSPGIDNQLLKLFDEIRQDASLNRITIWGRKTASFSFGIIPLTQV